MARHFWGNIKRGNDNEQYRRNSIFICMYWQETGCSEILKWTKNGSYKDYEYLEVSIYQDRKRL